MQTPDIGFPVRRRWLGFCAALIATVVAVFLAPRETARAADPVDVQLVLAIDTSGSVSPRRFTLQQQGYVDAFRDPRVLAAIQSGMARSIAVTMFQWTGPRLHVPVVPWMRISDQASAEALSSAINAVPRKLFGGGTSVSGAIDYAMSLFPQSPYDGERRIIDVSGDGSNNSGRPAESARDAAVKDGVTINGLPILTIEPDLDDYYQNSVIGGEGSFVITVKTDADFAAAILKKLIAEIAMKGP
ncbi:MAG TPA: DUF1194 domain-containing protein [Beijerinckiaceae bacterium]|nr:DUF1194 domain-containing protein [Beijerinckiaceae bacterium]